MGTIPREVERALDGRYRPERELGRGGMATVYLATDLKHGRPVAIKVLHPDIAAGTGRDRFRREIGIVAAMSHPHILPLIDSGEADGQLWYIVPYVEGESLRDRLVRERQLPVGDALRIAQEVASALAYAHAKGVVHRDVKPDNILLVDGRAQLADFGIALGARGDDIARTTVGTVVGTPAYMSPEQASGESDLDARSDIYSLACVLHEMLSGEPPFTGPPASVMFQQVSATARPISERRPGVPRAISEALRVALAKTRTDRYADASAFAAALTAEPAKTSAIPSVAVLPFQNRGADPENELLADGITEDVIAQLAKVRTMKVISRASVLPFRNREKSPSEIASILGVTTLVEGTVRRSGDRVRIVAELIDASSGQNLWAETYDRKMTDIFDIQSDVAQNIANALRTELTPTERSRIDRRPTDNVDAYEAYLRARQSLHQFTNTGVQASVPLFRQAIALDPEFAAAHAALAYAEAELGEMGISDGFSAFPVGRAAAARALQIDPELAEGHMVTAYIKYVYEFDWAGAERSFRRAIELSPGNADIHDLFGRFLAGIGRYDEAIAEHLRAVELDPLEHKNDIATAFLRAGRYEDATRLAERSVLLERNHPRALATLGWARFLSGRSGEGIALLEEAAEMSGGEPAWQAQLGLMYGRAGETEKARAIQKRLEDPALKASPYHRAYVHTGLGEFDRAIDLLEHAVATRSGAAYGIKGSFLFAPLRGHPRFEALMRSMGL